MVTNHEETHTKIAFLMIGLMIGFLTGIILLNYTFQQENDATTKTVIECEEFEYQLSQEFLKTRTYSDEYNCVNYSNDWKTLRRLLGKETYNKINWKSDPPHMYNVHAYEPQTGKYK